MELLFASRILVGAGNGLISTSVYTAEVTSKELRGSLSILESVTRSLGMILMYSIGVLLPWYQLTWPAPLAPLLAFLLLLYSPESPVRLVASGKIEQACMYQQNSCDI